MALPAPAWRVKSRPCPFYQQGRCLFADSCNFVHSASVQRLQSERASPPPQIIQGSTPEPTVHSPQSVRSPPRSPRTAGILLALKGVIADDPDDILDDDTNKIPSQTPPSSRVLAESTNTDLAENNPKTIVTPTIKGIDTNREPENLHDENSPFVQPNEAHMRPVIRTIQSSPTEPGQENFSPARTVDLLSPVDSVNLKLMTFNLGSPRTLPTCEEEVIDSGFAETFPISSRQTPSAPSSPLKATFGVLSSPFASPASRVLSPSLSAFIGHLPQGANEDEHISDASLDSPTGRYSREIHGSEEYVVIDDSFEAESFEVHLYAVESHQRLQALQPDREEEETNREHISPEVQQVGNYENNVVGNSICASRHSSGSVSPSKAEGGDVIFEHSSPLALAPSISRSSSQDEDGEALSFSDLFVSNAAMESQTTVDFDDAEGENSPLGLIYAEYSDSPHSLDQEKALDSPCEAINARSPDLGPMPSPFSPVAPQEASPIPQDFLVEQEASLLPSPVSSPAIAYNGSLSLQQEKSSLDHSVSVFSPVTTSVEQHLQGQRPSPSMGFESFFSREDDEERLEEDVGEMRVFNDSLSPLPSPPLSYAKSPSPVPPVQEQLRPIPAPSESSMSMSALSPPIGLRPGSSHSRASRSIPTPDSLVPGVADPHTSRKVPFGFRHSVSKRLSKSAAPSRPVSILQPPLTSQSEGVFSSEEAATSPTNPNPSGLRPLRLSLVTGPFSAPSYNTSFPVNSSRNSIRSQRESLTSLSASHVSIHNRLLSLSRTSIIPEQGTNTNISHDDFASPLSSYSIARLKNFDDPRTAPLAQSSSWLHTVEEGPSPTVESPVNNRVPSPLQDMEEDTERESADQVFPLPSPFTVTPRSASAQQVHRPPMYALGTPKPTLMFAIASDDVGQVREVLESGDVNPNETLGPQSALEFALTNDQLTNKMEIVKTLLAFGADPKALHAKPSVSPRSTGSAGPSSPAKAVSSPPKALMDAIDPATRYYVERAEASSTRRTSALIHRSFFRPLTRVRYELIGQDRALEELFKVLSIHSRQLSSTPIVVLLCGPSGHGKSLLARKFGTLLDVPTHTVNMTALDSTQDLWRSYSMSPYETPSMCTLAEFLINNEGKRCVVVLDEIEKTRDEKTLWSLLMPWELGRCTFEANGRPVDCRNVVWLGTSNVGHDLVLEHHQARPQPDSPVTREEYIDLMGLLRPRVSQRLGASILSRVTSVLPFVPFTTEEKRAICYEALHATGGDIIRLLSKDIVGSMVDKALADYIADEGARSLHRAVSNQLLDNI